MAPSMRALVVIGALFLGAEAATLKRSVSSSKLSLSSRFKSAMGAIREVYTTNAICRKNNCVNPIFPGMEDMHRLQQAQWVSSSLQKTAPHMGFCKNAITYDIALPVPNGAGASISSLVQRQDNAASTMFYYHLSGLGYEAWDYQQPELANDCIKSIWRMTCFTYFPRAEVGKQDGAISTYIRPCQSSCMNYIRTCGVECCDESVSCVFSHTKKLSATVLVTTEGYAPHDGPSSMCTGGSRRSTGLGAGLVFVLLNMLFSLDMRSLFTGLGGKKLIWIGALAMVALSLQGCDMDVPIHNVANWRANPDYLLSHQYVPPGGSVQSSNLNSCSYPGLSQTLQCSGRGTCKLWSKNLENPLAFCECDRDWADPECRTKRKSQIVAYTLSIFGGFLGADQFYLGHVLEGWGKLLTFGGLGIWWVYDVIRIGSAPVHSSGAYRTANDLPHFAYVLSIVMLAITVGFVIAHRLTSRHKAQKRKLAMKMQCDEETREKPRFLPTFADAYNSGRTKPFVPQTSMAQPDYDAMFPPAYGSM